MEITHAEGAPFAISAMFDRVKYPPRGRDGGGPGEVGHVRLASGLEMRAKGRQPIPAGERLILEMPGGGGLGDPQARPREQVAEDVRNGLVSPQAAQRDYGVALDENSDPQREDMSRE